MMVSPKVTRTIGPIGTALDIIFASTDAKSVIPSNNNLMNSTRRIAPSTLPYLPTIRAYRNQSELIKLNSSTLSTRWGLPYGKKDFCPGFPTCHLPLQSWILATRHR